MSGGRLRVGYVGVAFESYYADEHDQYRWAITGLGRLADELDFDLVAIDHGIGDLESARQAADHLSSRQLDFLVLQAAACASGELLEPLAAAAPRLGLWATPEPVLEGSIQLHSLVSTNHFASIIRRYLRERGVPYKWFLGHIDEPETEQRFRVTFRALKGIKAMASARIGWIGGISPGFYNMLFDEASLESRFGTRVGTHTIDEVVRVARAVEARPAASVVRMATDLATEVTAPSIGHGPQRPPVPGAPPDHRDGGVRRAGGPVLAQLPGGLRHGPMHGLQPPGLGGRCGGLLRGGRARSGVDAPDELDVVQSWVRHPAGPHHPRPGSRCRPALALRGHAPPFRRRKRDPLGGSRDAGPQVGYPLRGVG